MSERLTISSEMLDKLSREHGNALLVITWCCKQFKANGLCDMNFCLIRDTFKDKCPYGVWKIPAENTQKEEINDTATA